MSRYTVLAIDLDGSEEFVDSFESLKDAQASIRRMKLEIERFPSHYDYWEPRFIIRKNFVSDSILPFDYVTPLYNAGWGTCPDS